MTCLEKLKLCNPNMDENEIKHVIYLECPSDFRILMDPTWCRTHNGIADCWKCWDREIPGTVENIKEEKEIMNSNTVTTKKTKAELLNEIAALKKEVENLDKYRQYEQVADELAAMRDALMNKGFTREEAISFIFNAMNSLTK